MKRFAFLSLFSFFLLAMPIAMKAQPAEWPHWIDYPTWLSEQSVPLGTPNTWQEYMQWYMRAYRGTVGSNPWAMPQYYSPLVQPSMSQQSKMIDVQKSEWPDWIDAPSWIQLKN